MMNRLLPSFVIAVAFAAAACAQDPGSAPASVQNPGQSENPAAGGYSQRGGRGGYGGGMGGGMIGRGLMGTVTAVTADHYTIKTDSGDVYTIHFTSDTRMFKRQARAGGPGEGWGGNQGAGGDQAEGGHRGMGGGNPPQQISATDIKAGDVINVMGETDATAKSVNARAIALMDQQTVDQIHAMEANFGKTWLMGKVTAIDGTKITLMGTIDSAPHTIVADENTEFRKRRDPITLADIQVGDTVRAEGALKDGIFTATTVSVFGMPGGETPQVPRGAPPSSTSPQ
jgi:hypothetical protein